MDSINKLEVYERIKIATNTQNDASVAAKLGISNQAVNNGLKKSTIPKTWIMTLASKYGISSDWLLYGKGEMKLNDSNEENIQLSDSSKKIVSTFNEDFVLIPLVEACLSAGGGSFETGGNVTKEYAFRKDFILNKGNPANMVLMRVSGDSMEPEIQNNDVVLIDQSKTTILASKIYAVAFDDCVYLKRIEKDLNGIILISSNKSYSPIQITLNEQTENQFKIIGRVLWSGREFL